MGVSKLLTEFKVYSTIHNLHKVLDYTRYDNIITSHISNTGGNHIIESDK